MRPALNVIYLDLGVIEYGISWEIQQQFFDALVAAKGTAGNPADGQMRLLLCEHPHVYTLGKSGHAENMLVSDEFLARIGAVKFRIDRGGDITYHGPGQLVGYPILDLEALGLGLREYIHALEQAVIDTLAGFGIASGRRGGATGVWVPAREPEPADRENECMRTTHGTAIPEVESSPTASQRETTKCRKICAIGVRSSRFVVMHGFALNVNADLGYFRHINPCGLTSGEVTSMERELGHKVDMDAVKAACLENFEKIMNIKINKNDYGNHKTLGGQTTRRPRDGGDVVRRAGDRAGAGQPAGPARRRHGPGS